MNNIAIKVENVSKEFSIGDTTSYLTLRDQLASLPTKLFRSAPKTKTFWALKNVSFEVKKGEIVGIIGRNGAGKSTLLKILSRITEPTSGKITMHGRVASMLEVGTGFNPELTGRENIYLNGAIIGMKKSEIEARFEDIVEFSGVGKFLDTPVKHYSSGMYVRLAFAVAAHLDSDILLVDEVLAVGDLEFQKKCLGKMSNLSKSGKTIIYVSHSLSTVENLCSTCVYLSGGKLITQGLVSDVLRQYTHPEKLLAKISYPKNKTISQILSSTLISIKPGAMVEYSKPITFQTDIKINQDKQYVYLGIEILNQYEQVIIFWRDFELIPELSDIRKKKIYQYKVQIPAQSLAPGKYSIRLTLAGLRNRELIDQPKDMLSFEVVDRNSIRNKKLFPWHGLTSIPLIMKVN